tara:strand:- start:606 stop:893 length:288 start_codon:yes stop_codon:yes gene_type:complete
MENSVSIQKNNVLAKWEIEEFKLFINRKVGLKNYDSKKLVSFYDDDGECYMVLRIPYTKKQIDNGGFDNKMLWLLDVMSDYIGASNVKYDGQFLC